ncbi:MAG: hypothetical protein M3Q90_03735 [Candidatus Dormibacteraeota bacterium]|nr:hypothetical protein [Candidatus Dormibacteraeota bacterium]
MPLPPAPTPVKTFATMVALVALAGCQPGPTNPRPVPSVAQIGSELKCLSGDHGYSDVQAGWGFCYPATWQYRIRAQSSQSPDPRELDITFDITDVPCTVASAAPGQATPKTVCTGKPGLFAFMIVYTYERGGAPNLAAWQANPTVASGARVASMAEAINWGNAVEAAKLADGRRIALTPHHVVILELRSGQGSNCVDSRGKPTPCYLDLDAQMSPRLSTWKFTY